jgi:hypothetical protein
MLHRLGFEGYREIAARVMEATQELHTGIERIEGLEVLGEPHMSIMAIGSERHDIYEVGDQMTARGWHLDRQQNPPCLHLTVNNAHIDYVDEFLKDLRISARLSAREPMDRLLDRTKYALLGAAARMLPKRVVSKVTQVASSRFGLSDGEMPKRSAAMYGMMAALPNKGDLTEVVIDALDQMTRYDPTLGEILPDHPIKKPQPHRAAASPTPPHVTPTSVGLGHRPGQQNPAGPTGPTDDGRSHDQGPPVTSRDEAPKDDESEPPQAVKQTLPDKTAQKQDEPPEADDDA